MATAALSRLPSWVQTAWNEARQTGDLETKALEASRAAVSFGSIAIQPYAAVGGAIVGATVPQHALKVCKFVDDMVTGIWNNMSSHQRIAAAAVGIPLAYYYGTSLDVAAIVLSLKLGAENVAKNLVKEPIVHTMRELPHSEAKEQ